MASRNARRRRAGQAEHKSRVHTDGGRRDPTRAGQHDPQRADRTDVYWAAGNALHFDFTGGTAGPTTTKQ
jgi:hypothetical protein